MNNNSEFPKNNITNTRHRHRIFMTYYAPTRGEKKIYNGGSLLLENSTVKMCVHKKGTWGNKRRIKLGQMGYITNVHILL